MTIQHTQSGPQHAPTKRGAWTGRTITSLIFGILILAAGIIAVPTGATGLWIDQTARDSQGFLATKSTHLSTATYGTRSESGLLRLDAPDRFIAKILGQVRIQSTTTGPDVLFVGIADSDDVTAYLAPIEHTIASDSGGGSTGTAYSQHDGAAPTSLPAELTIWAASATGTGQQSATWQIGAGDWTVVMMNADGTRPVEGDLAVAATLPWLNTFSTWLLIAGLLFLIGGSALILVPIRRSRLAPKAVNTPQRDQ
ncbi:hypothetical protein OHA70_36235 [Kribbella sp. NBC_00382]|uniref:hypothetical protein n=1 Tax=Kribbella sp. NBC_00382 TaxID=2975967 RepID=UPI002E234560